MPESILPIVFILALLTLRIIRKEFLFALSARIAMSAMLLVTAIAHSTFAEGMVMMLPGFIPFKTEVVYGTGVLEVLAAAGLLIPRFQRLAGWLLIIFFVLILPANIYAAINHVDIADASHTGNGPVYLWYRVPLQLAFIAWVYFSSVKPAPTRNIS